MWGACHVLFLGPLLAALGGSCCCHVHAAGQDQGSGLSNLPTISREQSLQPNPSLPSAKAHPLFHARHGALPRQLTAPQASVPSPRPLWAVSALG